MTPANADLKNALNCSNFGTSTVGADPLRTNEVYAHFDCQGTWKSTDYGLTWQGPLEGNGPSHDCAGGITVAPGSSGSPIIYKACIRGDAIWQAGFGFWRSTDGVNWTGYKVTPGGDRQDFYPPVVDPRDPNHLLMAGHEMNLLVESVDGGRTWTKVPTDPGMNQNGGTACIAFVDTGDAATTRKTFLWLAQHTGGVFGTWRTEDAGARWTRVDNNEHPHGGCQTFQPAPGVIFMAGAYSQLGWGILRSADAGKTWKLASSGNHSTVFGTSKYVYATAGGGALGLGGMNNPSFIGAALPGTSGWRELGTPAAMTLGPSGAAVIFDGQRNVIVGATGGAGLWRYIEP